MQKLANSVFPILPKYLIQTSNKLIQQVRKLSGDKNQTIIQFRNYQDDTYLNRDGHIKQQLNKDCCTIIEAINTIDSKKINQDLGLQTFSIAKKQPKNESHNECQNCKQLIQINQNFFSKIPERIDCYLEQKYQDCVLDKLAIDEGFLTHRIKKINIIENFQNSKSAFVWKKEDPNVFQKYQTQQKEKQLIIQDFFKIIVCSNELEEILIQIKQIKGDIPTVSAFDIFQIIHKNPNLKIIKIQGIKICNFEVFAKFFRVAEKDGKPKFLNKEDDKDGKIKQRQIEQNIYLEGQYQQKFQWIKLLDRKKMKQIQNMQLNLQYNINGQFQQGDRDINITQNILKLVINDLVYVSEIIGNKNYYVLQIILSELSSKYLKQIIGNIKDFERLHLKLKGNWNKTYSLGPKNQIFTCIIDLAKLKNINCLQFSNLKFNGLESNSQNELITSLQSIFRQNRICKLVISNDIEQTSLAKQIRWNKFCQKTLPHTVEIILDKNDETKQNNLQPLMNNATVKNLKIQNKYQPEDFKYHKNLSSLNSSQIYKNPVKIDKEFYFLDYLVLNNLHSDHQELSVADLFPGKLKKLQLRKFIVSFKQLRNLNMNLLQEIILIDCLFKELFEEFQNNMGKQGFFLV